MFHPDEHEKYDNDNQNNESGDPPEENLIGVRPFHGNNVQGIVFKPYSENDQQQGGGDVFNNVVKDPGKTDLSAPVHLFPAFVHSIHPGEEDNFDRCEKDQAESPDPVIPFVQESVFEEEDID